MIEVDHDQLATFTSALFRYADEGSWVSLRAFRDDVDNEPPVSIKAIPLNGDLGRIAEAATAMARRCAGHQHAVVFCPPLATFADREKATEAALVNGLALSVELDKDADRSRKRLEFLFGQATVVVASGGTWADPETGEPQPKLHVHWRLKEPTRSPEAHLRLKRARAMATALVGGDATNKPVVHPIRWPGSVHRKGEPKLCQIVTINPDAEIDLHAALGMLFDIQPEFRKETPHGKVMGEGEDRETPELVRALSRGEDFHATLLALAMRFLKRGMAPEHVVMTLRGLMQAVPVELRDGDRPGRWQSRYDDIPRTVRQGQEKLGIPDSSQARYDDQPGAYEFTLLRDLQPKLDRREIIKGTIPAGGFGVAYAEPGAGKTAILIDMTLHVAAGMTYRERRVDQRPVLFVALEGHGGIGNRIIAAAEQLDIEDAPFALITCSDNFRDPATSRKVAAVAEVLGQSPLVIIDTFTAALAGGSDCDPKDVGQLIESVKAELMAQGCTVLLIHHSGKELSRGARGWSGLLAACDFEFEVSRDEDLRTLRVSKMRDGSDSQPAFCYRLNGVELGRDQHGDPVTAVIVEHLADEEKAAKPKRHSSKARSALNVLWEMIKDPSQSYPLPEDTRLRCVIMAAWETECIKPGAICKCQDKHDRAKKFRAAKDELAAAGAIICDGSIGERVRPAPKHTPDETSP